MTDPSALLHAFRTIRARSVALIEGLSAEDCAAQSMPDASPAKWHLAHTTWFFETFVLETHAPEFRPFHPAYRVLFNSYYNQVGDKHPRPRRGLLTRPGLEDVLLYRQHVDAAVWALLTAEPLPAPVLELLTLGLHHEQQHQELLVTDLTHLLFFNPLAPPWPAAPSLPATLPPMAWLPLASGVSEVGHTGTGFCYDNELPRHRTYIAPGQIASRLVRNAEYLAFVESGGYHDPAYWLAEGWDWLQLHQRTHPLYWQRTGSQWQEFTSSGWAALNPVQATLHVSYYEADAYARWAGARLATEAEWEVAVLTHGCAPSGALYEVYDTAWQWTQSSYGPYPGYQPSAGAVGEYNGKFMVNQYVLRGGSAATPPGHSRPSYRNFFPAGTCWQFSGIRLARQG